MFEVLKVERSPRECEAGNRHLAIKWFNALKKRFSELFPGAIL